MAELISLNQTAKLLNFSEDEIMELVRQRRIPNLFFPGRHEYVFPREEVLGAITPRPKADEKKEETKEPVVERRGRPKKQI